MATHYQSSKINGYMEVDVGGPEPVVLPIIACTINSGLSSIPTASLHVAIGREVKTGLASAVNYLDTFADHRYAVVYLRVTQRYNSLGFFTENWPRDGIGNNAYFKVFEGRVVSATIDKTRGSASFRIVVRHWLADLEASSAVTRQAQQITPQMLSANTSYLTSDGLGSGFFPQTIAAEYFTPANLQLDMWGSSFMPWLRRICSMDALSPPGQPMANSEALSAINRIEPLLIPNPNPLLPPIPTYFFGKPLQLDSAGMVEGATTLANAVSTDLSLRASSGMLTTSLWAKLLEWAATYDFAIVPLVSTAVVVPICPGNRTPWVTIYGQEYRHIEQSSNPPRPVRGVRLLAGVGSPTGVLSGLSPGDANSPPLFAGGYDNPENPNGQFIFQNSPRWAANVAAPTAYGSMTLLPTSPGGSVAFPGAGVAPATPAPGNIANQALGFWDAYARSVYIRSVLANRTASLQGKLRFDISPGSTVRIHVVAEKFIRAQTGLKAADIIFAEVGAVTCHFDAESMQASTAFQLINIRDSYENTLDSMSIERHPLYSTVWTGAPMSELVSPSVTAPAAFEVY
jgi:hypothetical protein